MYKLDLKPDAENLLKENSTHITTNGKEYFFMPYWFEKVADGSYIAHSLDGHLPFDLSDALMKNRQL